MKLLVGGTPHHPIHMHKNTSVNCQQCGQHGLWKNCKHAIESSNSRHATVVEILPLLLVS